MRIKPPSRHLKALCRQLGPEYRVTVIDLEYVINRDFGNGYDVEVSGVNTTVPWPRATIYMWKDKKRIIKIVKNVPQDKIAHWVEWLREKALTLTPDNFDHYGNLKEERTVFVEEP